MSSSFHFHPPTLDATNSDNRRKTEERTRIFLRDFAMSLTPTRKGHPRSANLSTGFGPATLTRNIGTNFWIVSNATNAFHDSPLPRLINHWWKGKPPILSTNMPEITTNTIVPEAAPLADSKLMIITILASLWIKKNFRPVALCWAGWAAISIGVSSTKFSSIITQLIKILEEVRPHAVLTDIRPIDKK